MQIQNRIQSVRSFLGYYYLPSVRCRFVGEHNITSAGGGNRMTVEELKAEAAKLGYNIIPKRTMPRKTPCVCGANDRTTWWTHDGVFLECNNCHKRSPKGKTEYDVIIKWNEMIERENADGDTD